MKRTMMITALGVLLGVAGCDDTSEQPDPSPTDDTPAAAESSSAAEAEEAPSTEEPAEQAEDEAAEPEAAEVESGGAPERVTFSGLVDGFAESQDEWMGKHVILTALYMNATSVGGEIQNVSLVESRDDRDTTVLCTFAETPESLDHLTQYDEITVHGTVDEFFDRAALSECAILE